VSFGESAFSANGAAEWLLTRISELLTDPAQLSRKVDRDLAPGAMGACPPV